MKIFCSVLLLVAASSSSTAAFVPSLSQSRASKVGQLSSALRAAPDDIIARARERAGVPEPPAAPRLFDDDLLDDMQQALLTMEQRVKEGPGSLTMDQVEELEARLYRIRDEMRRNQHKRPERPPPMAMNTDVSSMPPQSFSSPPQQQRRSDLPPMNTNTDVLMPPEAAQVLLRSRQQQQAASSQQQSQQPPRPDLPPEDEEGPAYDGRGGMGQPRGTLNTYIIEGMEDMTSEEYRLALQQSLIDRQQARRRSGVVGNISSSGYLSWLDNSKTTLNKNADNDNNNDGSSNEDGKAKPSRTRWAPY